MKPSEEQQGEGAFQVKDKTSSKNQPVQKIEKPHETQQHTAASAEAEQAKPPEAITAMINMCEEPDVKPKVMEESNSMLQVISLVLWSDVPHSCEGVFFSLWECRSITQSLCAVPFHGLCGVLCVLTKMYSPGYPRDPFEAQSHGGF